jgi:hypothetical protein
MAMLDDKIYRVVCSCGVQLYRQEVFDDISYGGEDVTIHTRQTFMLIPDGDEISQCPGCHGDLSSDITDDVPEIEPYRDLIRDALRLLENSPLGTVHDVSSLRRFRVDERRWKERAEELLREQGA